MSQFISILFFSAILFPGSHAIGSPQGYLGSELQAEYDTLPFFIGVFRHQVLIYRGSLKLASATYGDARSANSEVQRFNRLFSTNSSSIFTVENGSFAVSGGTYRYIHVERLREQPSDSYSGTNHNAPEQVASPFGGTVEKSEWWWEAPNGSRLFAIPTPANGIHSRRILEDRLLRAVDSTKRLSFELFPYVNQLKFPLVTDERRAEVRTEINSKMILIFEAIEQLAKNRALPNLTHWYLKNDDGTLSHELDPIWKAWLEATTDHQYPWAGAASSYFRDDDFFIKIYGPENIRNSKAPSRVSVPRVREFLQNVYINPETSPTTIIAACHEHPDEPEEGLDMAAFRLLRGGHGLMRDHLLSEAEFVYLYNKVFFASYLDQKIDYKTPSEIYQACFLF